MTLRRRAYLREEVRPGTVIDNGILRIVRGDSYVSVTDLRFAGLKGKSVNRFFITFWDERKSAPPIRKVTNWFKRARSYPQALSAAHEAIREAETLAIQNGEPASPWMDEWVQKGIHIPPTGKGNTRVSPTSEPFGHKLKATTRGRAKTTSLASGEGGRPKVRSIKPKASAPQGAAPRSVQNPKRGNVTRFPELREYTIVVKGKALGTKIKARTALKALDMAGFKPDSLSDTVLFTAIKRMGIESRDYGKKMAIDIRGQAAAFRDDFDTGKQKKITKKPVGAAAPKKDTKGGGGGNLSVPKEILRQLGGNKFIAMTGAKNIAGDRNTLTFRLPKAKKGINHVSIRLNSMDTYDVVFSRVTMGAKRGPTMTKKAEYDDVYNDMLRNIFEKETGLYTSL